MVVDGEVDGDEVGYLSFAVLADVIITFWKVSMTRPLNV